MFTRSAASEDTLVSGVAHQLVPVVPVLPVARPGRVEEVAAGEATLATADLKVKTNTFS